MAADWSAEARERVTHRMRADWSFIERMDVGDYFLLPREKSEFVSGRMRSRAKRKNITMTCNNIIHKGIETCRVLRSA